MAELRFNLEPIGIAAPGKFYALSIVKTRLAQKLIEREGHLVSRYELLRHGRCKGSVVKQYISEMRPLFNELGFTVHNDRELGYQLSKRKIK